MVHRRLRRHDGRAADRDRSTIASPRTRREHVLATVRLGLAAVDLRRGGRVAHPPRRAHPQSVRVMHRRSAHDRDRRGAGRSRMPGSTPRDGRAGARPPGTGGATRRTGRPKAWQHLMRFRPGTTLPEEGVQAEGLLVVDPGSGEPGTHLRNTGCRDRGSLDPRDVARRPSRRRGRFPRRGWTTDAASASTGRAGSPGSTALEAYGDRFGAASGATVSATAPRVWCTWYRYFEEVTAADVLENLGAIEERRLPVDVVQIDDGWSLGTGEWTDPEPALRVARRHCRSHPRQRQAGGLWLAPFCVGSRSDLATPPSGLAHRPRRVQLGRRSGRPRSDASRRPRRTSPTCSRRTARPGRRLPQARLPVLGRRARPIATTATRRRSRPTGPDWS